MKGTQLIFGTSNSNKLIEAKQILEPHGYKVEQYHVDLLEIQDSNLEKIAKISLENLPEMHVNIFVEDTGLFIESLNGFPGPYASFVFKTIGNTGILKLLKNETNKKAYFESYIAFKNNNGKIFTFQGKCEGEISNSLKGEKWGFDPIFIPYERNPEKLSFSELGNEIKNDISHRAKALHSFKDFLINSN